MTKKVLLADGASLTWGSNNSATQQADPFPVYVLNVAGPLGTLSSRGYDTNPGAVNRGVSGRTIAQCTYLFDKRIAPYIDTRRPGLNVIVFGDAATNTLNGGASAAQTETDLIAYMTKARNAGAYVILWTPPDHSIFYSGGTVNPSVSLSAVGVQAKAYTQLLRSNGTSYPNYLGLWDVGADPLLMIDKFGNGAGVQNCTNTGLYDVGAAPGHFSNPGYQYLGTSLDTFIDGHPGILDSAGRSQMARMLPLIVNHHRGPAGG